MAPVQSADEFIKGLWRENPVFVHLLGLCPVLAVSNSTINAIAMGLATTFVIFMSSTLVSLLRKMIPAQVRIASFILIIATFVTLAEYVIQAISIELYKDLGAFIALIVVNCTILGRAEAFASRNGVGRSMLDALGTGLGFTIAIVSMGVIRELLGAGSILGYPLLGSQWQPWIIMILPGGGFFVLGFLLYVYAEISKRRGSKA